MFPSAPFVVLISAQGEWQALLHYLQPKRLQASPYGEYFSQERVRISGVMDWPPAGEKFPTAGACRICHRSLSSPAADQLGTCGGLEGLVALGEILLITETAFYDIYEGMADSAAAIDAYRVHADLSLAARRNCLSIPAAHA